MVELYQDCLTENVDLSTDTIQGSVVCDDTISNVPESVSTGMSVAECQVETQKHIEAVRKYIRFVTDKLTARGVKHDSSKLESPEVELFAEFTPILSQLEYGTEEYQESLDKLAPALNHHYASNRHHPEHFVNGISDMTLIDILEMFCDWKASSLRTSAGNLLKSIEHNAERFNIDSQLKQILVNTARMIDEQDE